MNHDPICHDCQDGAGFTSRRAFLKTSTAALAAAAVAPVVRAADAPACETLVTQLYKSLSDAQRGTICLPFAHELRSKIDNNWMINKLSVAEAFNADQQAMVRDIFRGLHSEEYGKAVWDQVIHDSEGDGFEKGTSVVLFGEPGTGKFEFVLTGRHVTRRCDGDSVAGTAFGGPIFYGHAAGGANEKPDHPGNAYWYQAKRANEVFAALDGKQRERALLNEARPEQQTKTVQLSGKAEGLPGLALGDMTPDQRGLVQKVLADLLAPFRKPDAGEAMKHITESGLEKLHLAFFRKGDIGDDKIWDVWQIEGPDMLWYFRGSPHVHCWANIRAKATA